MINLAPVRHLPDGVFLCLQVVKEGREVTGTPRFLSNNQQEEKVVDRGNVVVDRMVKAGDRSTNLVDMRLLQQQTALYRFTALGDSPRLR
ncbi:hypothetical protein D3H55_10255 [Bacillus salacetis]|uniref:Uncharacterized protein n=1 Tax=Bacillus salacetis TaxID=2315464 RepID=A0A3A1R1C2_9BACI|nr:hypothetical protein D3H55_10255 [Bacillus salacetis]